MDQEDKVVFLTPKEFLEEAKKREEKKKQISELSQLVNKALISLKCRELPPNKKFAFSIPNSEDKSEDDNKAFFSKEVIESVAILLRKVGWKVEYEDKNNYTSGNNYARPTTTHQINFVLEIPT
ncbi:MAG: hypothetical protein LBO09_03440 [Candidatus Peribacteria bacterium]|jgi:hypothetical protein|nr:hypothetical protein [Candidatus Peribacteria bacterium]